MLPFTMRLAGTGTFRPVSQVVFVQVVGRHRRVRAAGAARCAASRSCASWSSPTTRTSRSATTSPTPQLDEAFEGLRDFVAQFRVDRFTLYSQDADGNWHTHREFALTGC